ncbi:hypothetical protein CAter282_1893 [Collimonas arenae]|uniref:Uncharacterized protein n=1 Tax=Collimonas arenae TaxID=279058 RepID=A0A127QI26_9BURK|nr:hypothetical protein CAter10_2042 [Collimonas arenae]AMP09664.1 hypothetical protein CAter282_1893 [Collimonas arenae]
MRYRAALHSEKQDNKQYFVFCQIFIQENFLNFAAKTNSITVPLKAYLLKNLRDGLDQNFEKYARKNRIFL